MSQKKVLTLSKLDLIFKMISVNTEINDEGEEIIDFLASKEEDFSERIANEQEEQDKIDFIFNSLTETQEKIIKTRYGFDGKGYKWYQEVANILGYKDRRSIESIEKSSLRKIRHKLENLNYFNKIKK